MVDVVGRIEYPDYGILRGCEQTAAILIVTADKHLRVESHQAIDFLVRYELIGDPAMLVHGKGAAAGSNQAALSPHEALLQGPIVIGVLIVDRHGAHPLGFLIHRSVLINPHEQKIQLVIPIAQKSCLVLTRKMFKLGFLLGMVRSAQQTLRDAID